MACAWDEINGLFDRLSALLASGAACPAEIRGRIDAVVRALSWNRPSSLEHVRAMIETAVDRPVDAFAPAIILRALLPDDPEVAAWTERLPREVVVALRAIDRRIVRIC